MMKFSLGFILSVSTLVMFGWFAKIDLIVQCGSQSFVPMQFNTALCFLLLALGFLFRGIRVGSAFSFSCFAIAALTFSQYLFHYNMGIDEMIMDHYIVTLSSHPGRMAPNTSICFMLLSCSSFFFGKRLPRDHATSGGLSLAAATISLVSLSGYLSSAGLETWGGATTMALHTATCFSILSLSSLRDYWLAVQDV